ncbi:hypothetical protein GQ44DRAFT_733031 [Phaeosphaeriaceae sp. PMI808]|nr:hypothetical protein GQ44DRAFT_733031 [Phaeosphaeriaceae sp. PMI808]
MSLQKHGIRFDAKPLQHNPRPGFYQGPSPGCNHVGAKLPCHSCAAPESLVHVEEVQFFLEVSSETTKPKRKDASKKTAKRSDRDLSKKAFIASVQNMDYETCIYLVPIDRFMEERTGSIHGSGSQLVRITANILRADRSDTEAGMSLFFFLKLLSVLEELGEISETQADQWMASLESTYTNAVHLRRIRSVVLRFVHRRLILALFCDDWPPLHTIGAVVRSTSKRLIFIVRR